MKLFACIVILVIVMGCVPKRLSKEEGERVPLCQALPVTLSRYQGVSSLQAQVLLKLGARDEYYLMRGLLLYERPARLRLRLTSTLGGTVGEVIYSDGLLYVLLPVEGKIFMGWIGGKNSQKGGTIFLKLSYRNYEQIGRKRLPTRIYGEVEGKRIRFELRLKDLQIDLPLPEGVFSPTTGGWEVHPLEDLKDFISTPRAEEGP